MSKLYGLVLTGGKSSRMGRDKATLRYGEKPQFELVYDLLSNYCDRVFLSTRSDQTFEKHPQISDTFGPVGPLGGILSAFKNYPNVAWLVVACDLPFLDDETLRFLIAHRNPEKMATTFVSSSDGLPEPLCAIYEPAGFAALQEFLNQGIQCPRKILIRSDIEKLVLPNPQALDNVNTPAEYETAKKNL